MPCLLALIALAAPRAVIVLLVIFTDYIGRAYDSLIIPFLGFLFLPTTTLAYAFGINTRGAIDGIYLVLVIAAVLLDLGVIGGTPKSRVWRRRS
jgi:hypothetical protein